jgi:SAM-dependent methyltransferase
MSASASKERKSNFYDSAYLAEYYDILIRAYATALDTHADRRIYIPAMRKLLGFDSEQTSAPFIVLDVGTGTGRVLANLTNDAVEVNINLSNVEFIGVDKEPAMVHHASAMQQKNPSMSQVGRVNWLVGDAINLTSAELLQNKIGQVNLILFAAGGIAYLTEPDEQKRLFCQVAALLRPITGRFYLSVQRRLNTSLMEGVALQFDVINHREFLSGLYNGVVYKAPQIGESVREGQIVTTRYHSVVVKRIDAGGEEILEDNHIELKQRLWDEAETMGWATEARLHCEEAFKTFNETYFVFKRAD